MDANNEAMAQPVSESVDLVLWNQHGIREITPESERWLRSSTKSLVKHLRRDKHIEDISVKEINRWIGSMTERGLKPVSINSYLRAIKTIYSRLNKLGVTEHNPAKPINFLPEGPKNPKAISYETYMKLLNAADTTRDKAILSVFWATGCRLGGLISMNIDQMDHWDMDGKPCFAIHVKEKYSKPRWVYVDGDEAVRLLDWVETRPNVRSNALFLSSQTNTRLAKGSIAGMFKKLRRNANITAKTITNPHSFRHAFAIRKLDEGHDLALVSQWLGHNDPAFTASVYAIRSEAQLRAAFFKRA